MPQPLLKTKLHVPHPRPERVPRPRLIERLTQGLTGPLTVISAPALGRDVEDHALVSVISAVPRPQASHWHPNQQVGLAATRINRPFFKLVSPFFRLSHKF